MSDTMKAVRERLDEIKRIASERSHCFVCAETAAEELPTCIELLSALLDERERSFRIRRNKESQKQYEVFRQTDGDPLILEAFASEDEAVHYIYSRSADAALRRFASLPAQKETVG